MAKPKLPQRVLAKVKTVPPKPAALVVVVVAGMAALSGWLWRGSRVKS
jgi:hypothetical protein